MSLISVGERSYEIIGTSKSARLVALFISRFFISPSEVFEDASREKYIFLENYRYLISQCFKVIFFYIMTADDHLAVRHIIKSAYKINEAGLSRTGGTHDPDGLAGLYIEIDISEDGLASLFVI